MSSIPVNKTTSQATVFDLLRRLHFYIGLFVAPFIFIAALTGTLYVLTPQIENMIYANALFVPERAAHNRYLSKLVRRDNISVSQ